MGNQTSHYTKKKTAPKTVNFLEQPNPRNGKKSFFFGGEFEMPILTGRNNLTSNELAVMCCKTAVHCNLVEVYWWAVYKHSNTLGGAYTLSIRPPHVGRGYAPQVGIILIKKADTEQMTEAQVAEMLDAELFAYSEWLSVPMAV